MRSPDRSVDRPPGPGPIHPEGPTHAQGPADAQAVAAGVRLTGGDLGRAVAWTLLLAGVVALVSFEQGTLTSGEPVLHELFHDARHLLGFPCH